MFFSVPGYGQGTHRYKSWVTHSPAQLEHGGLPVQHIAKQVAFE